MTQATHFSEREHQICAVAHMVEDAKTYWVTGGGSPMAAILLAKKLYAPDAVYVTEDGVLGAEPALPFESVTSSPTRTGPRGRPLRSAGSAIARCNSSSDIGATRSWFPETSLASRWSSANRA